MSSKRTHILLTLIQCGETRWDRESRLHGVTDLPLSDAGRASVTADATRLAGAACRTIYHPPDEAATETARLIASALSAKTKATADLVDPDLGLLEGMLLQRFAEQHPKRYKLWQEDPLALVPPEGEPIADARARLFRTVARLLKKSRAREIGVLLHPLPLGLLRCWLENRPLGELWTRLSDEPRVERYAVAMPLVDRLRDAAAVEMVGS